MSKKSKLERLQEADNLAEEVWIEMVRGRLTENPLELLGVAVGLQTSVNRIVWKLNHCAFDDRKEQNDEQID